MATKKFVPGASRMLKSVQEKTLISKKSIYSDIMLDLETLDTSADAVILSIGAVRFNATTIDDEGFYRVVTIQSNIDEGRSVSGSTLKWWIGQDEKAKAVFNDPTAVPLETALDEFRAWVGPQWEHQKIWANSPDFDCTILRHAYGKQDAPWKFYNTRCFRTIKELPSAKKVPKPVNAGAHNAMFDAIAQAEHLQAIWAAGSGV